MEVGTCNLVHETISGLSLVISCQGKDFPTDREWDAWLAAVERLQYQVKEVRLLALTDGGHPTKNQMERLRVKNRTNPLTALVSPSYAYRFMASALSFINPAIRCFSPADIQEAFEHIGLARDERERVLQTIERLQGQLTRGSSAA